MAKVRRGKPRPHRSDPVARAAPENPELAALREKRILPVLKDLQSSEPKSRTAAAEAIANIIQDAKCRKLLLREQVVNIVLTETLTDSSLESRAAGWEILKVLAQEEESDFCVHLFRVDVLTAIEHAAKTVTEHLTAADPPFAKTPKVQQRFILDVAASVCSLVTSLAVARDEILEAIVVKNTITNLLFILVSSPSISSEVSQDALLCLLTLSEDNKDLCQTIVHDQVVSCYDKLSKLSQGKDYPAAVACGILHNVFSALEWCDHSPGLGGACDAVLVPRLTEMLHYNDARRGVVNGHDGPSSADITQTALEVLASIATDVQGTLERSNRADRGHPAPDDDVAMDEDEDEDEDEKGLDDDEELGDADDDDEDGQHEDDDDDDDDDIADIAADMEMVTGADDREADPGALDDLPTLKALLQKATPQLIIISAQNVENDEEIANQAHALAALNNLAWTVSCIDFKQGENKALYDAWHPCARGIWTKTIGRILASDTADVALATQVTSLAWAVARSLQGNTPLQGDQHNRFIALYQASKNMGPEDGGPAAVAGQDPEDPFQGLGVKCIGVLGQLARDPAPLALNRDVGVFLVTVLSALPETPAADAVEALNQLFDIYGDENLACDSEVFWKDGFLRHLEEAVPKVKAMAKSINKRTATELRTRADEAALNLGRFIQYKKKHMARK